MSAPIPTTEPAQLRAGETLYFSRSLPDYPADDSPAWVIYYSIRGPNEDAIDFQSTNYGGVHLVEVAYTTTELWKAGTYYGTGIVRNGTQAFQVWQGQIEVLPNLSEQPANFDARSFAQRTLDKIRAIIESRAGKAVAKSRIQDNEFTFKTDKELMEAEGYWLQRVTEERRAASGKTSKTVFAQFCR